jgi:hypothetical protein
MRWYDKYAAKSIHYIFLGFLLFSMGFLIGYGFLYLIAALFVG